MKSIVRYILALALIISPATSTFGSNYIANQKQAITTFLKKFAPHLCAGLALTSLFIYLLVKPKKNNDNNGSDTKTKNNITPPDESNTNNNQPGKTSNQKTTVFPDSANGIMAPIAGAIDKGRTKNEIKPTSSPVVETPDRPESEWATGNETDTQQTQGEEEQRQDIPSPTPSPSTDSTTPAQQQRLSEDLAAALKTRLLNRNIHMNPTDNGNWED
jgi:hypothetical protein